MEKEQYDPDRMRRESEHPVDEGCTAQEHDKRPVGFLIPVSKLVDLFRGKIKWGWR